MASNMNTNVLTVIIASLLYAAICIKSIMVVFTGLAVATVVTGGAAAGAAACFGAGVGGGGATFGSASAVGTAIGVGVAGGAITGAAATGTAAGAGIGVVAGGTAAVGVGSSGTAMGALTAGTLSVGPFGLLTVGADVDSVESITYDCWKPVVHEASVEPSNGMLLKDMVCHPHVAEVTLTPGTWPELPNIVLRNRWNETFEIEYVLLHATERIVGHAKRV